LEEETMPDKILVVDDDPDIRDAATIILESQGYEVVTASNGVECLASIKSENPDLLILDLLMPKMDGFAVCKELQDTRWSKYRKLPILVLSSVREDASRRRYELETGLELDVNDYVEKPISPKVLLERVRKLLKSDHK
jgi:DNA-binding response OmpR family regulator